MTLIGASIEQNSAWVWANTEFYQSPDAPWEPGQPQGGDPLGHNLKLFVNERAALAAAGMGTRPGNMKIKAAAAFADSFDDFCSGLSRLLKDQAGWLSGEARWTCVAAGWSRSLGRMAGVMITWPDFRPQLSASGFARPYVRGFESLFPCAAADILPFAQEQMRQVQRSYPKAGAGSLVVAHVQREAISLSAFDLPTGRRLPALPDNLEEFGEPFLFHSHLLERGVA